MAVQTTEERIEELETGHVEHQERLLKLEARFAAQKEIQGRILDLVLRGVEPEGEPPEPAPGALKKPEGPVIKFFPEFSIHQPIREQLERIAMESGKNINEVIRGLVYRALGYKA